jgi:two-component system sensor histidine kinase DesK
VTQAAIGVVFAPINQGSSVMFIYSASFIAQLDRPRDALRGVILIAALAALTALLTDAPPFFWVGGVLITLVVGGVNLHFHQEGHAQRKLRLAHAEIEQLAAIAERECIARDLHDVLGHTLSLIVLKAELAVKLSSRDPERAAREMHDVEDVARRTLQDVRHAIRGYRATLAEEIERSRTMLKASRIADDFDVAPHTLPHAVEETLALALREAVTNVVRHSGASRCNVSLSCDVASVTLVVHDDGRGSSASPGLGLRGMRERVEEVGGSLDISGRDGMRITVTLPLPSGAAGTADDARDDAATRVAL